MDADFSHDPNSLLDLHRACSQEGADMSIGSRYIKGGGVVNWDWYRLVLSYGGSIYVRMITGMSVKDATAGFVCYKKEVLQTIDLDNIKFVGYAFQIEMKYNAHKLGFKLKEVPITFKDREEGVSKMSTSIVGEAIKGVISMRMSTVKPAQNKSEQVQKFA
jgi:dolichol-phosphate mannosyltransferase